MGAVYLEPSVGSWCLFIQTLVKSDEAAWLASQKNRTQRLGRDLYTKLHRLKYCAMIV